MPETVNCLLCGRDTRRKSCLCLACDTFSDCKRKTKTVDVYKEFHHYPEGFLRKDDGGCDIDSEIRDAIEGMN